MQYVIVTTASFDSLQYLVRYMIEQGWVPQGGPVVAPTIPMQVGQAMIKAKN